MEPKVSQMWKDACDGLKKAEQHFKMGESELAKKKLKRLPVVVRSR